MGVGGERLGKRAKSQVIVILVTLHHRHEPQLLFKSVKWGL